MKKKKRKPNCVVCGARNRNRFQDTCDAICTRAKWGKKSRGEQNDIELRAEWRKPIPVDVISKTAEEIEYNRPYMVDVLTDRRND